MPNVSFSGKENPQRSSWQSNLGPCQMLSQLSHWTHGEGVEASLPTARLEASVTSAVGYTAYNLESHVKGIVSLG